MHLGPLPILAAFAIGFAQPLVTVVRAQPAEPQAPITTSPASGPTATTRPAGERPVAFPGVIVDRAARQVRVECEALALAETPLEFLCVTAGGPEHESLLRTQAKPSHIHAGLLLLGLDPGSPVVYSEALNAWTPPHGPGVRAIAEWVDANGQTQRRPAEQLLRSIRTNNAMPATTFIFAGSHVREGDGAYLADLTGYVVSICNFEHTLIDVPRLVSSANESLEWETDLANGPVRGTPVTLILEPVDPPSTTQASEDPRVGELRRRRAALAEEVERLDAQIDQMSNAGPRAATRAIE